MKKELKKRKKLERKYTRLAIYHGHELPEKNGRLMSVSPTAYYHVVGVNAHSWDMVNYRALSYKVHHKKSSRQQIEDKIHKILKPKGAKVRYLTYVLKDIYLRESNFESFNYALMHYYDYYQINKNKYAQLKKLFNKFGEESKKFHYKPNNAEKRISKNNSKNT